MADDFKSRLKNWLETGKARLEPMAFSQRELWQAAPVPATEVSNHICSSIVVRGTITPSDCETAIQRVVNRQEALRTSFLPGKVQPVQIIHSEATPAVRFRDLPSSDHSPEALDGHLQEIFDRPFDLPRGPLYRVEVLRRGPEDLVLVFAIHHAIADGWSLGVFVQDLCAAYLQTLINLPGELPAVPQTYADWAAVEREAWPASRLERAASYWKSYLAGADRLWTSQASQGPRRLTRLRTLLSPETTTAVRTLARQADATLFTTLLTGFQIALSRWTGKTDIVVGTPVANRTTQPSREAMGYCAGNVPLRGHVDAGRSFLASVRAVHRDAIECFASAMPFVELVRTLNDPPRPDHNSIFDVRFALQNHPIPDVDAPSLSLKLRMHSTGTARFDLGCEVTEIGNTLEVVWLYRPELFSRTDLNDLFALYQSVLASMAASPENRAVSLTA